jgi:hypothetical protein
MISVASAFRSSRGLRLICKRPLLGVMFTPSTPMKDDRLATSSSFRISRARARWRSARARNDTDSGASEMPRITPVSCTGKKPLGATMYRRIVSTSVATVTSSVAVWCRRTQASVLPYQAMLASKPRSVAR